MHQTISKLFHGKTGAWLKNAKFVRSLVSTVTGNDDPELTPGAVHLATQKLKTIKYQLVKYFFSALVLIVPTYCVHDLGIHFTTIAYS
jgi:hypothetical protein